MEELKQMYIDKPHTAIVNGNRVEIVNDPKMFPLYKSLGLDVFKPKPKKKNDSTSKG